LWPPSSNDHYLFRNLYYFPSINIYSASLDASLQSKPFVP
jgi:hypothetical protein